MHQAVGEGGGGGLGLKPGQGGRTRGVLLSNASLNVACLLVLHVLANFLAVV